MILTITDKSYMVILKCATGKGINIKVDTGAAVSALPPTAMWLLTGYKEAYFKRLLNKMESVPIMSLSGTVMSSRTYLRNCSIDDVKLPTFHCLLADVNQSVLGMDFIMAGRLIGDDASARIEDFDYDKYLRRVEKSYKSKAYEISCLGSEQDTFVNYCTAYGVDPGSRESEKARLCSMFGWESIDNHLSELK